MAKKYLCNICSFKLAYFIVVEFLVSLTISMKIVGLDQAKKSRNP